MRHLAREKCRAILPVLTAEIKAHRSRVATAAPFCRGFVVMRRENPTVNQKAIDRGYRGFVILRNRL